MNHSVLCIGLSGFILICSFVSAVSEVGATEMADPRVVVNAYQEALVQGDLDVARGALGDYLTMLNGGFSGNPSNWQAHLYLWGDHLDRWLEQYLETAGPHANRWEIVHFHERGGAALVVTKDTGSNRFRTWQDEIVAWTLGRGDHGWKIIGLFIRDLRNPGES
jgi:hypothetical protein